MNSHSFIGNKEYRAWIGLLQVAFFLKTNEFIRTSPWNSFRLLEYTLVVDGQERIIRRHPMGDKGKKDKAKGEKQKMKKQEQKQKKKQEKKPGNTP